MKYSPFLLALLLTIISIFSGCTSTSEPEALSDFAVHTQYEPVIIPYYMFDYEGLEIPQDGSLYRILNSSEDVYDLPRSDVFVLLQNEIYNNFDFSRSSIILISVLGEIEGPAPHCAISFSYNNDKSANLVTIRWKEGIKPIKDIANPNKDKAALIQYAIGVGKIPSDTPIVIRQEFS